MSSFHQFTKEGTWCGGFIFGCHGSHCPRRLENMTVRDVGWQVHFKSYCIFSLLIDKQTNILRVTLMREVILRIQRWKFFLCSIKARPQGEDISSLSQPLAFWVTLGESLPFSSFFCLDHSFFKAGDASFCLVCTSAAYQLHVGGKSRFPPFLLQHLTLVAVGRRSGCIGHETPVMRPERSFSIWGVFLSQLQKGDWSIKCIGMPFPVQLAADFSMANGNAASRHKFRGKNF